MHFLENFSPESQNLHDTKIQNYLSLARAQYLISFNLTQMLTIRINRIYSFEKFQI